MLQCPLVAVRPLRVEELAELLAFEFDTEQGGIPKYRAAWRLDDQTQAVLSTCSSLVTIVDDKANWYFQQHPPQVVQFSHFSVKEFLLSNRLTSSISRYRIHPAPAHTILTQACIGFLLHLDEDIDEESAKGFPLADYAARNWVEHAKYKGVASHVKDGMETLFDPDKPYFAAWIGIHDIDKVNEVFYSPRYSRPLASLPLPSLPPGFQPPPDSESDSESKKSNQAPRPNPLYYSVLCGFYDLAKHLVVKFPQYINAIYGRYDFPLFAALSEDHVEVGRLLLEHGAKVDAQDTTGSTILLKVLSQPHHSLVDIVTLLLKHGANVNLQDRSLFNALHLAEYYGELEVAQILLIYKADFNSRNVNGGTPLHFLSGFHPRPGIYNEEDILDHARLLLKYGADINSPDSTNKTPLHVAVGMEKFTLARILIEHGANALAEDDYGTTPLHLLSASQIHDSDALDLVWLLLGQGAEVNRPDESKQMPLHLAIGNNWFKLAQILLDHGADANAEFIDGWTPLLELSASQIHDDEALDLVSPLLEHGAELNKRNKDWQTPLQLAIWADWFQLAHILLDHDADANVEDMYGRTPLLLLSTSQIRGDKALDLVRPLLEHGAELNKRDNDGKTSLQLAMMADWFQLARILLDHGADASTEDEHGRTLLHLLAASRAHVSEALDLVCPLLEHGAVLNRQDEDKQMPLHLAIGGAWFRLARILLDKGANAKAEYDNGTTPLHLLLSANQIHDSDALALTLLLLEHGAEVNSQDKNKQTPLLLAIEGNWFKLARILLEHGADADASNNDGKTSLHILLKQLENYGEGDVRDALNLRLEHGAEINRRYEDHETPLLLERGTRMFTFAWN